MITAAQAQASGVARSTLYRREMAGSLQRVRTGVYRHAGAPASQIDDVRAAWLASNPSMPAWERLDGPDVVVGGSAAAWVHQIGDLYPSTVLLYTRTRRQSKQDDIRYSIRQLPGEDVTAVDGLPVTTRERTIADLLAEPGADLSIVADALRDAERADDDLDTDRLVELLRPHAKRLGQRTGVELYEQLRAMTHVDEERVRNLLVHTNLPDLVASLANERTEAVLQSLLGSVAGNELKTMMAALRGPLMADLNAQVKDAIMPMKGGGVRWGSIVTPRVQLPTGLLPKAVLGESTRAALASLKMPSITPEVHKRISELAKGPAVNLPKVVVPKVVVPKTPIVPKVVVPKTPIVPKTVIPTAPRVVVPKMPPVLSKPVLPRVIVPANLLPTVRIPASDMPPVVQQIIDDAARRMMRPSQQGDHIEEPEPDEQDHE
ncbi:type IV toxin-antitoxin system AbiEi family antitoxin [Curtobacterium sp. MCPF17_021]|uniref:type IV toxin-antitoxin system AbiEi family antitoxin domain-containing protein n=1 Tax=Curtobacterium sp. MCPF17_021 TaxID=2175639 RepID=UPI0024DF7006|nr:type IV toxin-antitoxin system AbiEi family antitoxin [Curtobacterium sp. MCPF17_021]WIE85115.1 type IV toxin-antitoxin system AbiEi family antitoxin [Curtobacterium sp. MCPF17_021]